MLFLLITARVKRVCNGTMYWDLLSQHSLKCHRCYNYKMKYLTSYNIYYKYILFSLSHTHTQKNNSSQNIQKSKKAVIKTRFICYKLFTVPALECEISGWGKISQDLNLSAVLLQRICSFGLCQILGICKLLQLLKQRQIISSV